MGFGYRGSNSRGSFRTPRGSRGHRGSFSNPSREFRSDSYRGSNRGRSYSGNNYHGSPSRASEREYRDRNQFHGSPNDHKYRQNRYSSSSHGSWKDEAEYPRKRYFKEPISYHQERSYSRRSDMDSDRKRMKFDEVGYSHKPHHDNSSTHYGGVHQSRGMPFKRSIRYEHPRDFDEIRERRPFRKYEGSRPIFKSMARGKPPISISRRGLTRPLVKSSAFKLKLELRRRKWEQMERLRRKREERREQRDSRSKQTDEERPEHFDSSPRKDLADAVEEDDGVPPWNKKQVESSKDAETDEKEGELQPAEDSEIVEPFKQRIMLKCPHCDRQTTNVQFYQKHLSGFKHRTKMDSLMMHLKSKLHFLRSQQRKEQNRLDEENNSNADTLYCKLCQLNFKQSHEEHGFSVYHQKIKKFLRPRCFICNFEFQTPATYEHHLCTVAHLKRKVLRDRKSEPSSGKEAEEENNEDLMIVDAVGSSDEEELGQTLPDVSSSTEVDDKEQSEKKTSVEKKKTDAEKNCAEMSKPEEKSTLPDVGSNFVKEITCYHCELCDLTFKVGSNQNKEIRLISHCRTSKHLSKLNLHRKIIQMKNEDKVEDNCDDIGELEIHHKEDDEDNANEEGEDGAEDSHSGTENRYDRFSHDDE